MGKWESQPVDLSLVAGSPRSLLAGREAKGSEGGNADMKTSKVETTTKEGGKGREGRLACGAVTVEACTTAATVAHSRGATRCVSSCLAGWPLHPCYGHPPPTLQSPQGLTYMFGMWPNGRLLEGTRACLIPLAIAMNHKDCLS